MDRRSFLRICSTSLAGTSINGGRSSFAAEESIPKSAGSSRRKYRVGIIGATSRGGYGHLWHLNWQEFPNAELVALADYEPQGREAAGKHWRVNTLYDDYRQMLTREKLDIVTVCPQWLDQREDMITACAAAGCHVFTDKPFAVDAASADRILAACRSAGVKVAVAHQHRVTPGAKQFQEMLVEGRLGNILSMCARGKEDHRAGGEDLAVLGCHWFDLMNSLAGVPRWAVADVLQESDQ